MRGEGLHRMGEIESNDKSDLIRVKCPFMIICKLCKCVALNLPEVLWRS